MTQHDATELVIYAVRQARNLSERIDALIEHARDLVNALDADAAGPWRTDVENAPKDGTMMLCEFGGESFRDIVTAEFRDGVWHTIEALYPDEDLLAFTTINTPENTP